MPVVGSPLNGRDRGPREGTPTYLDGQRDAVEDSARGIVATDGGGGYTISASGRVRPFGDAPPIP